jgi:adenylate cyclase
VPKIQYALEGRTVDTVPGESILAASLRAGIPHAHACGGRAKCSTCRVEILEGLEYCPPRNEKEQVLASRLHFAPQVRLACQTVITGDVTLRRLILDDVDIKITSQIREGELITDVGEDKELAVLFADIRDFTPFAEALPPYDVIHVLNRFFSQMGRAITQHGGHIDNYMGDGLMALFGLPGEKAGETAALRAVRAGLGMLDEMESFKRYLQSIYGRSLEIGVGIHYGDVVVGSIGSEQLMRVTAIGDTVNVASRVESANKQAGTKLLISPSTFERLADVVTIGKTISVNLKGTIGETVLREVIGVKAAQDPN